MMTLRLNDTKKENLTNNIQNNINSYKYQILILENLKLLTKKDGSDFQNINKCFDIESLKQFLENKGYSVQWLYLHVSDYDFEIHFKINGTDATAYIKRRIYTDEITQDQLKEIDSSRVLGGGWIRKHYYLNSTKEIENKIQETITKLNGYLEREQQKLANTTKLFKVVAKFTKDINELMENGSEFYLSEIQDLIGY